MYISYKVNAIPKCVYIITQEFADGSVSIRGLASDQSEADAICSTMNLAFAGAGSMFYYYGVDLIEQLENIIGID